MKSFLGAIHYIAKFLLVFSGEKERMRHLLGMRTEWEWTEGEKKDFIEKKKKIVTEIPCLAHFAKNRDNMVATDRSKTELRKNSLAQTI